MADLDYLINFNSNTAGIDKSKFAINKLAGAMAALGVGFGASELASVADEFSNIAAFVNIAVGETGDFEQAMTGVKDVALATNTNLTATTQLFYKINEAGKQMGLTQQDSLELTETINKAMQLGGGAAASNEAAIIQLTQALQSGVLRGEEFNSIMEQAPGISKALAASLGVTTGDLRAMANEGKLSAQTVISALQEQSTVIASEFDKLPITVDKALQNIRTQWTVLIGEFNQESGATSKVVEWLGVLEDNMSVLETVLADVGEGISWVGDQISGIDTGTIVAMKQAFESAYEALKSMATAAGEGLLLVGDTLEFTLGMLFDFESGLTDVESKTAGFTKAIQFLNVALGFISDGFVGITVASKLITGAFYEMAASFQQLKSNFVTGSWKDEAIANMNAMQVKAQEMYDSASEAALNFKSKGIEALEDIKKTEAQVNAETLADLQANFAEKAQAYQDFTSFETNYAAEMIALEQKINEARSNGDSARIAEYITQLDIVTEKEKESAEAKLSFEKSKTEAAQEYAQQAINSNKGVLDSATKIELATQNYIATVDEAGKVTVTAFGGIESAANEAGLSIKDVALNAAKGLGIDVTEALNQVSSGFDRNAEAVRRVADGYGELKRDGLDASGLLYASLEKLLAGAKSQAEIDEVRKLYVHFGKDGKISTEQVERGIDAINGKLEKTPELLDETARAFKELGIISQAEADKQAKAAIANYELVKKSGQANAGQLSEALDGIYSKIKTSGDSTLETWYNNQTASLGFSNSLKEVERSATRATTAIKENTAARKEQSTATWNAKFATDEATKSESASLAFTQRNTQVIKDKISALNALSGTADTTDESYEKLMKSMGFYEGYKWLSLADYARDMERVQAAVDKQAESYSEKNNKKHRGSSENPTTNATPSTSQYAPTSTTSAPAKTIVVELRSNTGTVNATIPESQEAMLDAFVKQLQESKALAGQ
ncbi:tape measure protein [Psychrobacter cibarius]|nr:tape measure protein [Psychrobacter cibarius]